MQKSPGRAHPASAAAGRALSLTGGAILAGTVVALVVAAAIHLRSPRTPLVPIAWCRAAGNTLLPPLTGARWFSSWQFDGVATAVVVGTAAVYLAGVVTVRRRRQRRWPVWRTACFLAGLGVCLLAASSVIGVYDMALFSMHMLGHLALVMVAPPLLVIGQPLLLAREATEDPWRPRIEKLLQSDAVSLWFSWPVALASYAVVIVGTHLTGLMDVIMVHAWAGQLEHLAYVLIGYQFFTVALGDEPLRWRLSPPAKVMLLALAMGVDTITGVVLFQSTQAITMQGVAGERIDPLSQTTLGGAIMWVGGDGIMVVVMLMLAVAWLRRPDVGREMAGSWLEQARAATLASHTSPAARHPMHDVDEDDRARVDYNAWLRRLAHEGTDGSVARSGSSNAPVGEPGEHL